MFIRCQGPKGLIDDALLETESSDLFVIMSLGIETILNIRWLDSGSIVECSECVDVIDIADAQRENERAIELLFKDRPHSESIFVSWHGRVQQN
jgi:hypothetical protein